MDLLFDTLSNRDKVRQIRTDMYLLYEQHVTNADMETLNRIDRYISLCDTLLMQSKITKDDVEELLSCVNTNITIAKKYVL